MIKHFNFTRIALLGSALVLTACWGDRPTPDRDYMPDMYKSTAFKAQSEDAGNGKDGAAARVPPKGTIPRGFNKYNLKPEDTEKAGKVLKNPLPRTKAVLERGQKLYNTYCIVCHGSRGTGEGYVVPPYPRPPTLLSDKVVKWNDGSIFNVISNGQNLMPSYASQLQADDRWAVIHYVRVLQRAANPTDQDLKELGSPNK